MSKKKRTISYIGVAVFLGLIFICILSVSIRSNRIDKEFSALKDYSKLFHHKDFDFEWKKHSYGFWKSYTYNTSNFYTYRISPIGKGFIGPAVAIVKRDYKNFPEDIWSDFSCRGMFYYPTSNYYEKKWDGSRFYTISFDKAYTVSQLQEQFTYGSINWLWLDTYSDSKEGLKEYYIPDGNAINGAYGILCKVTNNGNNLQADAQEFVEMINKYDSQNSSKTGKKLYEIKHAIKPEGDIAIEDLKIIGCIFYPNDSQDKQMQNDGIFKVVK